MAFQYNGQPVNIYREFFRSDGVRYENLLDASVRQKIGIVETVDPDPFEPRGPDYDQRFYWGPDNPKLLNDREEVDQDGNPMYVQVYNPLTEQMEDSDKRLVTKGLKSQWIAQVKETANKMLAQSDWMVIRQAERGVAVPDAVADTRNAIIAETDRLEAAITACADVEALIAVVGSQNWPRGE